MINEKEFQDRINRRLSGLDASEQRRMRIRLAVNSEKEKLRPMKRSISSALLVAIVTVMMAATVAFADHLNLFSFFGRNDERYTVVAPHATLAVSDVVLVEHPELGDTTVSIDSAYFDGLSLNMAYRITHGRSVDPYSPTDAERTRMETRDISTMIVGVSENEPGIEILRAWNQAIENGIPFGYRKTSVYTSDHTTTDDGVEILLDSVLPVYNDNGDLCEMREFVCPLPDEIRSRQEMKVNVDVNQETVYYWFDGTQCYWRAERTEVGTMTAVIPRNGESKHYFGSGRINGVTCTINAEVSPMAAVLTIRSAAPINTILAAVPEGTDEHDCWVEVVPADEKGNKYRMNDAISLNDSREFTLSFMGTGKLPETMTVYVYSMWEERDEPDIATLEGICLKAE